MEALFLRAVHVAQHTLLPQLGVLGAAELRGTCKTARDSVAEFPLPWAVWPPSPGKQYMEAACLTVDNARRFTACFPRTRALCIRFWSDACVAAAAEVVRGAPHLVALGVKAVATLGDAFTVVQVAFLPSLTQLQVLYLYQPMRDRDAQSILAVLPPQLTELYFDMGRVANEHIGDIGLAAALQRLPRLTRLYIRAWPSMQPRTWLLTAHDTLQSLQGLRRLVLPGYGAAHLAQMAQCVRALPKLDTLQFKVDGEFAADRNAAADAADFADAIAQATELQHLTLTNTYVDFCPVVHALSQHPTAASNLRTLGLPGLALHDCASLVTLITRNAATCTCLNLSTAQLDSNVVAAIAACTNLKTLLLPHTGRTTDVNAELLAVLPTLPWLGDLDMDTSYRLMPQEEAFFQMLPRMRRLWRLRVSRFTQEGYAELARIAIGNHVPLLRAVVFQMSPYMEKWPGPVQWYD